MRDLPEDNDAGRSPTDLILELGANRLAHDYF
jgi:hypothetical protein